jgi:hypothetical protein
MGTVVFTEASYRTGGAGGDGWAARCLATSAREARATIVAHGVKRMEGEYKECPICMETFFGRDFAPNLSCGHRAACFQCTGQMCEVNILVRA